MNRALAVGAFALTVILSVVACRAAHAQVPIYTKGPSSSTSSVPATAFPLLAPDGAVGAPSYSLLNETNTGWYRSSAGIMTLSTLGGNSLSDGQGALSLNSTDLFGWGSGDSTTGLDTFLVRDGAGIIAQKRAGNAQTFRLYFTTTGPNHLGLTARGSGGVFTATGSAMQLSMHQTTAPTCTTNCGSGSTVAGTDSAGIITLGTTPASAFQVNFNGTWPSAPSCGVQSALATMVVGKMPIAVAVTTTTMIVTTNGTAPSTSDKYQYVCIGVT